MHLVIRDLAGAARSRNDNPDEIRTHLAPLGIDLGQIAVAASRSGRPTVADAQALATLHKAYGIRSADRVKLTPGDRRWPAMRSTFRQRHAFDAGREPDVDALRLFASIDGWVTTLSADASSAPCLTWTE